MARRAAVKDGTFCTPGESGVTTSPRGDLFDPECPTRRLLDRIGGKWVNMVVTVLADDTGEVRFGELRRRMPGVSQKMLSQTLAALVLDGLVRRRVEDTTPPAVHYALTPLGLSLTEPLAAVREWAEAHMAEIDRARIQAAAAR